MSFSDSLCTHHFTWIKHHYSSYFKNLEVEFKCIVAIGSGKMAAGDYNCFCIMVSTDCFYPGNSSCAAN
jgi:hypothetical protein